MKTAISLLTVLSLVTVAFVSAQESVVTTQNNNPGVATFVSDIPSDAVVVSVSPEGNLTGKVFQNINEQQQAVTAKVTISTLNGETVASSATSEEGTFEFPSIEPGYYTIIGVGAGFYGDEVVNVKPHGEAYTSFVPVQLSAGMDAGAVYASHQAAPIATFSGSCGGGCGGGCSGGCGGGSCGGGCSGGGFGGGGFGGGGRGLFAGRGLRGLLPFVGLAGLAGINSNDDDASPAN